MRERLGDRLPQFSDEDRRLLAGSSDFFGLNHYSALFAENKSADEMEKQNLYGNGGISEDQDVELSYDPSWKTSSMGWSFVPWGCRKLLQWIDARYGHPPVVITENGCAFEDELVDRGVRDADRVEFLQTYLSACHDAIEAGVDLRGYFVWTLLDNFEWSCGFTKCFGLHYTNFETGEWHPKDSAAAYAKIIADNGVE